MDWLVVIATRVRRALRGLLDAGWTVYAPLVRERRGARWGNYFMLGRYLLVQSRGDWASAFHLLREVDGVSGVLRWGDEGERPVLVRDGEVQELKAREKRGVVAVVVQQRFVRGQRVVITRGAFASRIGWYGGEKNDAEERVEIDCLGRVTALVLPVGSLIPA